MSNVHQLPPAASGSSAQLRHRDRKGSGQLSIAEQMLARMAFKHGERILQLSCGSGWATRVAAKAVAGGAGMAAGLDPSPEEIARARTDSRDLQNVLFVVGDPQEIPWRDEYFNQAFSLESFDEYGEPQAVLRELHRVLMAGGLLHILGYLYNDQLSPIAGAGKHAGYLRCEEDYKRLLRAEGFEEIASTHLSESTLPPGHCEGTLLLTARRA